MFITFEGQEGAGKSTQIALLYNYLLARDANVVLTRDPGGTEIAEKIREIVKDVQNAAMSKRAEALLYIAARAQLVEEVIMPQLTGGGIVLCDRFADSTMAYQGFGNGLDVDDLGTIGSFATSGLVPDITFYLRIDAKEGLARKLAQDKLDRIEQKDISYHMDVGLGYEYLAKTQPRRIIVIDGALPQDEVHQLITKHIENLMN
ncbi:MAG: dTMP kinase [Defluviitaleaceae bacterium]|nr:dTMP kinase [Defluviitaleaceae bacterium]